MVLIKIYEHSEEENNWLEETLNKSGLTFKMQKTAKLLQL